MVKCEKCPIEQECPSSKISVFHPKIVTCPLLKVLKDEFVFDRDPRE
jgi:hypothetical protein